MMTAQGADWDIRMRRLDDAEALIRFFKMR